MLYLYPDKAKFGRIIPKKKFYEHASVGKKLKDKFVNEIESVTWQYKLAEETINLTKSKNVPEIQVFEVILKPGVKALSQAVLESIDKAIPFLIIFQIYQADKVMVKAAYKRPAENKDGQWVIEKYFESEWLPQDQAKTPLPQALDLENLHKALIQSLMPRVLTNSESENTANVGLDKQVETLKKVETLEKEIAKLKAKRNKEPQFNRQIEINKLLKQKQQQLSELIAG